MDDEAPLVPGGLEAQLTFDRYFDTIIPKTATNNMINSNQWANAVDNEGLTLPEFLEKYSCMDETDDGTPTRLKRVETLRKKLKAAFPLFLKDYARRNPQRMNHRSVRHYGFRQAYNFHLHHRKLWFLYRRETTDDEVDWNDNEVNGFRIWLQNKMLVVLGVDCNDSHRSLHRLIDHFFPRENIPSLDELDVVRSTAPAPRRSGKKKRKSPPTESHSPTSKKQGKSPAVEPSVAEEVVAVAVVEADNGAANAEAPGGFGKFFSLRYWTG
jgi:hypothetical protein